MNNKIEKQKLSKQISLSKWLETEQKRAETKKELQRAQIDRKYQRKLRSIETRYERELKNEKIKEKNKLLQKQWKEVKSIKIKPKKVDRVKKCDDIFSKYIRKKYWPKCYTCETGEWTTNWHRLSRKYRQYRWHESNCRSQCRKCNSKAIGNGEFVKMESVLRKAWVNTEAMKEYIQIPYKKPQTEELKEIYERYLDWYKKLEW